VTTEVKLYDRDGVTLRTTVAGLDLQWSTAKGADADGISFSVSKHEDDWTPNLLDDAIAIVYTDFDDLLVDPVAGGTPYVVAPTGGTVFGENTDTVQVVGNGVLAVTGEWPVLHHWHSKGIIARLGPQTRTFGWPTPSFDDSSWLAVDMQDPEDTTFAKLGRPMGFGDGYVSQ
jgi:hypothetical protein